MMKGIMKVISRPTKETLSNSYILQVALDLIDQVGLEKFTMRKLGTELGVSAMAVYRYFPNQKVLFDNLVEGIWQEVLSFKLDEKLAWQKQLTNLLLHLRQVLAQHPNVLPLISTRPIVTDKEFVLVDKILTNFVKVGLEIQPTTVFLINSLIFYTIGFVWGEDIDDKNSNLDLAAPDYFQSKSVVLQKFMQPFQESTTQFSFDEQFLMGIKAILAGWQ
ncbi:TetR/AcrR family transcriptional regulator [Bombilactobacillus folatiphilus]|uniref:TetR/AcrR family transcriptional regulator n=1 Tax=Bombilactobacillus folatiphilus TaxID=2923362 RepID=A0ABY4P881_9LACO|nr:TetR/AcrR family transcriptional regulator [Bombilactobacillus folatiphilus]UQS81806.1 TetR/AcrR family transcriptional regulator [Bombilactobacillus folatiphilus]